MSRDENVASYVVNEILREFDVKITHEPLFGGDISFNIIFNPLPILKFKVFISSDRINWSSPDEIARIIRNSITKEWYNVIYKEGHDVNA